MTLTLLAMQTAAGATPSRGASAAATEFDEQHRGAARAAGRPTERMLAPGIFGSMRDGSTVDTALVWTNPSGGLAYFCARESRTPIKLTIGALDRALALPPRDMDDPTATYAGLDTPRRLIVSDHQTLRRLTSWVKVAATTAAAAGDGDYTAGSVHRRLVLSSRLFASTRLIVLTRALTRKFWLGAQYDPEDFGAWRRAFGFGAGATVLSVMNGLVEQASEGKVWGAWAREAFNSESYALMSAGYPGLRSAVAAFGRVETADTATRAIMTTDPLLRERALLDGSMSMLRVLTAVDSHFTASVSTPFKLRAGKRVLLINPRSDRPGDWGETSLQGVTVARVGGQDQLIANVSTGRAKTALAAVIAEALSDPARTLLVTENPYLPFGRPDSGASRWTQGATAREESDRDQAKQRRDIPLDVIVAGAPTL